MLVAFEEIKDFIKRLLVFVTSEKNQDFKILLGGYWCLWHLRRFKISKLF